MPARRAMSSVEDPCSPRSANSRNAASRISSRRSSFVLRSLVFRSVPVAFIRGMLVVNHYLVKGLPIWLGERDCGSACKSPRVFDHVTIRASDRAASEAFYRLVLPTVGLEQTHGGEYSEWDAFSVAQASGEK